MNVLRGVPPVADFFSYFKHTCHGVNPEVQIRSRLQPLIWPCRRVGGELVSGLIRPALGIVGTGVLTVPK
jgi:hypothetical protein